MNPSVDLLRAVLALAFVLGLIWLLGALIRKYGWRMGLPTPMTPSRIRRLQMIETMTLDGKNRLVLFRRDNVEHLVLVGSDTTQVIETAIKGNEAA
jgi:flagellar protein FliO/FliZ